MTHPIPGDARGPLGHRPVRALSARWCLPALLLATAAAPALGQEVGAVVAVEKDDSAFGPEDLGVGPYDEMSALMEVTLFNIDVLTLTVRVGPATGARLRALSEGREFSEALADSVAAVMLECQDMWARQVLHRDVGFGRLMGGMRETSEKAMDAGYITRDYFDRMAATLPELFGFLEEDGSREGDEIFFLVRGDRVRTVYRSVDGEVLLDRMVVDPDGRRGSIPSFFAPETRFRKRLVESLLER